MKVKYLFILFVLLLSCSQKDKGFFEFNPNSLVENEITLSEIADDVNYIPLDNSFPLGGINSAFNPVFKKNCMYLYENEIGIFVFSMGGKFLRKVGSYGRGPGQYLDGRNFSIDDKTETVYVHDSRNIIKIYSKTGDFQKNISLQVYGGTIDKIEIFNSRLFVSYNLQYDDAKYEWIILDTLGNLIKQKKRTMPIFESNYLHGGGIYIFDQKLNFWNQFIDTVFSFSPDFTCKTNFVFIPGEYRVPKSKIDNPLKQLPKYFIINQIFETKKYLTIRYSFYKEKNGFIIIDKNNKETFLSYWNYENYGSVINDLDGGVKFLPRSYLADDGREYLVELIDPYRLKAHVISNKFKSSDSKYAEKGKALLKLANNLKETDNPVLMVVRLKK
jgi:hypothetical protein